MTTALAPITRWPALMRAETAAAYLDEVSPAAFLRAVRAGTYPAGRRVAGKGLRWAIEDLDQARIRLGLYPSRPRSLRDRVGQSS